MKALVLSGGKGSRLRPLTDTLPKQLIPVANRPILYYVLDHLRDAGIEFVEAFETARADAVVLLREVENPRMFGVAEVDGEGRIRRLVEKPQEPRSKLALVGVYVLGPSIHEAIAEIASSLRAGGWIPARRTISWRPTA